MASHFDPQRHHRRSLRLRGYDYTLAGAYFITLVTHERTCLFGEVVEGQVVLNALGRCVEEEWLRTPSLRPYVALGEYVIMPNHVHGIVFLTTPDVGAYGHTPLPPPVPHQAHDDMSLRSPSHTLGAILRGFKGSVTVRINTLRDTPGNPIWQRNFYERIIRNEREHDALAAYVWNNPAQWAADRENPAVAHTVGAYGHTPLRFYA